MTKPVMLVIGTRPESIKMLPVYFALKRAQIPVYLCSTTQHSTLLHEVFDLFGVRPDSEFNIMRPGQDLFYITSQVLEKMKTILLSIDPCLVLVQGDTTSAMSAALASFYMRIPLGHIEAGLRTKTINSPFPEEMNRRFISMVADYHYAPTALSVGNLLAEGIDRSRILCTGNTVVDSLRLMQEKISNRTLSIDASVEKLVTDCKAHNKKLILLTAHRRESFNGGINSILNAIKKYASTAQDVVIAYVHHPNPAVLDAIKKVDLTTTENIKLFEPLDYSNMIYLLLHATCVATDSGGLYEEAISIGKHVLILRNETERVEGVWAGFGHLVGVDETLIIKTLQTIMDKHPLLTDTFSRIYGNGSAAHIITQHISTLFTHAHQLPNTNTLTVRESIL